MSAQQLRDLTATLIAQLAERETQISEREAQLASRDEELKRKQLKINQLTHEMATLKRWRYGRHSEQLDAVPHSTPGSCKWPICDSELKSRCIVALTPGLSA
jgi:septal ring factor EnvC (AmiA/AmiB activator)